MDWSKLHYTTKETATKLSAFLKQIKDSTEAEIRLGKASDASFNASIDESDFQHLLSFLQQFSQWKRQTPFERSIDYFFKWRNRTIRSSVTTVHNQLKVDHVYKETTDSVLIKLSDIDVRISLKEEVHVHELPTFVNTDFVRIKERKSFYFNQWRYDFTKVWQGKSVSEAEQLSTPRYEVEVECLQPLDIIRRENHVYLAVDFIQKIRSMFPTERIVLS
jgi:hypothetical protein